MIVGQEQEGAQERGMVLMLMNLENNNNNQEQPASGTDGHRFSSVWCYGCNCYGHYVSHCSSVWSTTQHNKVHIHVIQPPGCDTATRLDSVGQPVNC